MQYKSIISVDSVKINKELHAPTIERFNLFYDIIKTKPWFDSYYYWVVGSFVNVLNNNQKWNSKDIDMVVVSKNDSNLREIKEVLIELTKIAINDCGFLLDVHFNKAKEHHIINKKLESPIICPNSNSLISAWNNIINGNIVEKEYKNGVPREEINQRYLELFKLPGVLVIEIFIQNDIGNNTWVKPRHAKEVYDGLWERYINFPTARQMEHVLQGLYYESPIDVKSYYKNR